MRALSGVLVTIVLCLTGCSKKAPEPDSQALPKRSAQPPSSSAPEGDINPRKVIYPVRGAPSAQSSAAPAR